MTNEIYIEDPKLESLYRRFEKLGTRLKMPVFRAYLGMEVRDGEGNIIHAHRQRSHSWNRNAYNFLFSQMAAYGLTGTNVFEAGAISLKWTSGNIYPNGSGWALNQVAGWDEGVNVNTRSIDTGLLATAGTVNKGIIVGTNAFPESFEGYVLGAEIANGSSPGQMDYAQSDLHSMSYDAPTKTLTDTLIRFINNNSGASIGVNEVGLYGRVKFSSAGTGSIMFSRDVLASTVDVPSTGQLKVTYTIQLAYPA
ncbi:hypothetical protein Dform_01729 [Dehalogenimonas formicexedens]|uniref:Uncharacterized protein n=1 Tax=Dehalogenimonas formicexedens TaxID=1839801 RepID=A0A1P8F9C6_9CHLR|nr:hypothetical protein [Dehalogenimonas formicexedens]APV45048.1 hypothetical protein Dform_01729 [Dehalogenimonas formicexedens]